MKKKLSSLLLAGCMMLGMLPTVAFADDVVDAPLDIATADQIEAPVDEAAIETVDETALKAADATGTEESASVTQENAVAEISGTYYDTLASAVNAVQNNPAEITVLKDCSNLDTITIENGKKITLNLNNKDITFKADNMFKVNGGLLDVTGTGTISSSYVTSYKSTIYVVGSSTDQADYSVVKIGESVTVKNNGSYGLAIVPASNSNSAYGAKMIVNGTVESTYGFTVNGLAKQTTGNIPEIDVTKTGKMIANNAAPLYAAGYAKYNIAGTLEGKDFGIEIRAGELTVAETAKISSTADFTDPVPNGNGSTVVGAAIAVSQHTTNLPITVNINGGTISSTGTNGYAIYEIDTVKDEATGNVAKDVNVTVSNGNFTGNVGSINEKITISGGTFSARPDDKYIAKSYTAVENEDGTYTVQLPPVTTTTNEGRDGTVTATVSGTAVDPNEDIVEIGATSSMGANTTSANITIEAATADALAGAKKPVAIATDVATVQFDQTVMEKIQSAQSNVNLVVAKADVSKVAGIPAGAAAVELKLVYTKDGKETEIIPESGASTNGNVTVTLAYDKAYNDKTIGLYYIKENKPSLVGTAAVADGKATFTVNHFSTYAVAPIAVSGIKLNKTTADMKVGDTMTLTATVEPDNATDKTIRWESSDENVLKVNQKGVVTAVGAGEAKITVFANGQYAECVVSVTEVEKPVDPAEDELLQPDPSCDGKDKCPTAKYNDLKNKDAKVWYHQAVDFVVLNEIMIGTTKDNKNLVWGLGQTISRAEIAQIMYNMTAAEGYEAPKKATFTDVPVNEWYFKAVEWANTDGCMVGTGEGKFEPTRAVTRQEYAAVMYRIVTKGMSAADKNAFDADCNAVKLDAFTDSKQIDNWAVTGVKMCVASEIMKGNEHKQLMPKKGATREEAAQMIMNFLNMEKK